MLGRLPESLVVEMAAGAQRVEYPKGAIGLRWDERPLAAIVLRGSARAFLLYPDGGQATTRYLATGDMVGVFAQRSPRIARGIQALELSELLLIESARMRELSMAHPAFGWALVEELTTVLNLTHRALYVRAFGTIPQRVALTLLDRARLAGDVTAGQVIAGTQSELATATGTVREVVATVLQALKRKGIVNVRRGGVVILDPEGLRREADGLFDISA
jgi:CRP/FNR family transcriptional regulator, cyclic AMP receptor protein